MVLMGYIYRYCKALEQGVPESVKDVWVQMVPQHGKTINNTSRYIFSLFRNRVAHKKVKKPTPLRRREPCVPNTEPKWANTIDAPGNLTFPWWTVLSRSSRSYPMNKTEKAHQGPGTNNVKRCVKTTSESISLFLRFWKVTNLKPT